jgi:hypothetical protein
MANVYVLESGQNKVTGNPDSENWLIATPTRAGETGYMDSSKSGMVMQEGNNVNESFDIWTKVISKRENVVQVVCGHSQGQTLLLQSIADNGNLVNQVHHDCSAVNGFPSVENIFAIMQFNLDGSTCVYQYSAEKDAYYRSDMFITYNMDLN